MAQERLYLVPGKMRPRVYPSLSRYLQGIARYGGPVLPAKLQVKKPAAKTAAKTAAKPTETKPAEPLIVLALEDWADDPLSMELQASIVDPPRKKYPVVAANHSTRRAPRPASVTAWPEAGPRHETEVQVRSSQGQPTSFASVKETSALSLQPLARAVSSPRLTPVVAEPTRQGSGVQAEASIRASPRLQAITEWSDPGPEPS